jgi:polyhydroxyalkanoate synthesis regulator phasin
MFETLNKLFLAGIGAAEMTRETAEQILDELARKGQAVGANRKAVVQDLMDSARATRSQMSDFVARQVRETVDRLNLASRDDIARLEAKLDRLLSPSTAPETEPLDQTMI